MNSRQWRGATKMLLKRKAATFSLINSPFRIIFICVYYFSDYIVRRLASVSATMVQHLWMFLSLLVSSSTTENAGITFIGGKKPDPRNINVTHLGINRNPLAVGHDRYQTSSGPTFTTILPSTQQFSLLSFKNNSECRENATRYVYENNLCGAGDIPSYLSSRKAFYSCSDRCGHTPTYSPNGQDQCACDMMCEAHNDCCRDMATTCPDVHRRGKIAYRLLGSPLSYCPVVSGWGSLLLFRSCKTTGSVQSKQRSPNARDDDSIEQVTESQDDSLAAFRSLPMPQRTVKELSVAFSVFKVADVSTGGVFESFNRFKSCGTGRELIPYFIPKIASLVCERDVPFTEDHTSATQILMWCRKIRVDEPVTRFHRSCMKTEFIHCFCDTGKIITEHVHHACSGNDQSSNVPISNNIFKSLLIQHNSAAGQCKLFDGGPGSGGHMGSGTGDSTLIQRQKALTIEISISPLPVSLETDMDSGKAFATTDTTNSYTSSSNTNNGDSFNGSTSSMAAQGQATSLPDKQDFMFVVEVSKTLERRFLCQSLENALSHCRLLDCAHGAILSHQPQKDSGDFGGPRCVVPVQFVVRTTAASHSSVLLCRCMQVLMVLTEVGIWDVKMKISGGGMCVIDLSLRPKGKQRFMFA